MDAENRKIPSHEVTSARLRDMILFGHLAPGAPVTIQGLISDLGSGMTPVREAIRRLTAEGALLPQGNRRVAVPELSAEMLEQVAFARLAIEPRLAELAASKLTGAQIDRLEVIDGAVTHAIEAGKLPDYLAGNHAFRLEPLGGAGGPGPSYPQVVVLVSPAGASCGPLPRAARAASPRRVRRRTRPRPSGR